MRAWIADLIERAPAADPQAALDAVATLEAAEKAEPGSAERLERARRKRERKAKR